MTERALAIDGVSAHPSVRPSHAGIDSKLMNVGSCSFQHRVAQEFHFWHQISQPRSRGMSLARASNETGVGGYRWKQTSIFE